MLRMLTVFMLMLAVMGRPAMADENTQKAIIAAVEEAMPMARPGSGEPSRQYQQRHDEF
ncbi:MAG: hypothetical protein Q9M45_12790 [Robiginitomaculum sp.]|nr:hypothetical protein [Robiginitomaculum sp.]